MSNAAPAQSSTVTGTATFRERLALPPDAVFEATLADVSRADASAEVLGSVRRVSPGNPPFRFAIEYDPSRIEPSHRYAVRAQIVVDGRPMFVTDTQHAVLTGGHPDAVDIVLKRAASTPQSTAVLENTYWKLVRLGATQVTVAENQREPHFVLQPETRRVAGSGGCNRLAGSYTLAGDKLTFSQMAGTMMACPDGMDVEREFHKALSQVASWRIEGEALELFDAAGTSIAQFESRYLK